MIVTEKKPFDEILRSLEGEEKIFIVGCGDCADLAQTGGEKEVEDMAVRLAEKGKEVVGTFVSEGPCHVLRTARELRTVSEELNLADSVLVLACGAGIQTIADLVDKPVHPGLNSLFLANVKRYGWFEERCSLCGECVLDFTGGICPVTRCAKSLVNGPCGGAEEGKCEIGNGRECVWQLIYDRLKKRGQLDRLLKYQVMKDFERSIKPGVLDLRGETQDERSIRIGNADQARASWHPEFEFGHRNWEIQLENVRPRGLTELQKALDGDRFVVTCELVPPKGVDVNQALQDARSVKDYVTAVNVNENPSSKMRLNSLSLCHLLVEGGIEPVFHITTRERNRLALQSELLGAYVLGIRNVVAMTGDHQSMGDHREVKPVYDLDSVQLLRLAIELMGGKDYNMNNLNGAPQFYLGGVINPDSDLLELQIIKMRKKARAGASFFITQAIYDLEKFSDFLDQVKDVKAYIIAGIIPLKSARMARHMNANIPGIHVPEGLIERMEKARDKGAEGVAIARDLVRGCRDLCQGVHLMPIGWYDKVPQILEGIVSV